MQVALGALPEQGQKCWLSWDILGHPEDILGRPERDLKTCEDRTYPESLNL